MRLQSNFPRKPQEETLSVDGLFKFIIMIISEILSVCICQYFQDALYGSINFIITPWGKYHHYLYFTSKENRTSGGWIALLLSGRTGTKMSQCKAHDLEKTPNSQQWKVSEWSHSLKLCGFEAIKMDRHTDTHWCLFVKKDALIHVWKKSTGSS